MKRLKPERFGGLGLGLIASDPNPRILELLSPTRHEDDVIFAPRLPESLAETRMSALSRTGCASKACEGEPEWVL